MSTLVLALVAGAVVGLALGALGGGGSVLAVPALIYLLGFTPAAATTASLIIVTATSATALYTHATSGNVRWRTGALFAAAGIPPAMAAAALAARLPGQLLTAAFAAVAGIAALRMLKSPARGNEARPVRPVRAAGAGAGLGAVTGFLGVGGGFLAVPALVGVLGLRMRAAIGTSLLVITVNSLAALTVRTGGAGPGPGDWAVVAPFTGAAVLAAWDGKRLSAAIKGPALQRIFAVVLLSVAAFMLTDAIR
ncbi:sulfite exporter TauE/SafE family protein [Streptomyces erythrochromogenes]|uniref:sulfite exporter TauE/SafE family protein n=1 Tax=Streptomyces erythrochromogenes TaxID=285574 RepID=UPI00363D66DA